MPHLGTDDSGESVIVDFRPWIGRTITEVITDHLQQMAEGIFPAIEPRSPDELAQSELAHFWAVYDVRTSAVTDSVGRTNPELVWWLDSGSPYPFVDLGGVICMLWDALEGGEIGFGGQRESVTTRDQPIEEVRYYQALEDGLWRLHNRKSRLVLFSEDGREEARFRRVQLIAAQPGTDQARDFRPLEDPRDVVRRHWDLEREGTRLVASEFRAAHSEYRLSQQDAEELVIAARGYRHKRGRIKGSKRRLRPL
jgi:hypothetical protein